MIDRRVSDEKKSILSSRGGLKGYVQFLDKSKQSVISDVIYIKGETQEIKVELALQWNNSFHENCLIFTNNIPQKDGGTHLAGFRAALTRTININKFFIQVRKYIIKQTNNFIEFSLF